MAKRSAFFPASRDPTKCCQFKIAAALRVARATTSRTDHAAPCRRDSMKATLSSPSKFLLPEGAQSEPRPIVSPDADAARMSAVLPYRRRLLNGDHTIDAP